MLGIDVYRYQKVTGWPAVKAAGVKFVYVKGSDGGAPSSVRADGQVRGAQSVGLPVGLYHYAQLSPSPEAQADVLTSEVRRLGAASLPPALDLESPWHPDPLARDFAHRFLTRLRANGFDTVTLYANTDMLTGISPHTLGIPGLVIWEANYTNNDGTRHPLPARPWTRHIHQYTSVATLPGISGRVDANESFVDFWEVDMATPEENAVATWSRLIPVRDTASSVSAAEMLMHTNWAAFRMLEALGALTDDEAVILAAIRDSENAETAKIADMLSHLTPGNVNAPELAAALAGLLGPELGTQVVVALGRALVQTP
jgi:GH25 family lysozyme M1 (1,4-beta-N-acetylmuramidase)